VASTVLRYPFLLETLDQGSGFKGNSSSNTSVVLQ
jgi:hypothetical protein